MQQQKKKRYIIDSESKGNYSHENPIKFLTSSLESSLCDYSDAYSLTQEILLLKNEMMLILMIQNLIQLPK